MSSCSSFFNSDLPPGTEAAAMKLKVNARLLPIKAHFFLNCAGLSPILPYMPVYAKQLGTSSAFVI